MTYNYGFPDNGHTIVSYVELFARQTTPIYKIKFLQGGLGLREMFIAVATFNTTSYNLTSYIYGYN